ncbi:unnamed protein product, partial [Allacma fusca]
TEDMKGCHTLVSDSLIKIMSSRQPFVLSPVLRLPGQFQSKVSSHGPRSNLSLLEFLLSMFSTFVPCIKGYYGRLLEVDFSNSNYYQPDSRNNFVLQIKGEQLVNGERKEELNVRGVVKSRIVT